MKVKAVKLFHPIKESIFGPVLRDELDITCTKIPLNFDFILMEHHSNFS